MVAVLVVLVVRSFGGGGEPLLTPEQAKRIELDQNPIEVTLSFSGDLLIHSQVWGAALAQGGGSDYDFAGLLDEVRPYVADADLAICHVETPMTPGASELPAGYPLFDTPPELAEGIADTGWDACDTASNHSLDQGTEGVASTIKALDAAGIEHTGSATSEREQEKPLILEANGAKIAYLAYTTDTNGIPVPKPYTVNVADPERIAADAKRAADAGADAVIVNIHWASEMVPEYVTKPSVPQQKLAARLAAVPEITAIVGQGPHVIQPIRKVNGKVVVFSEGNLISAQGADAGLASESQDGYVALLTLRIDGDGTRISEVRYVPTWVDHVDYTVLPVGPALRAGEGDEASLRASYDRTVSVVGREPATPEPGKLP